MYTDWFRDILGLSLAALRKKATIARLMYLDMSAVANLHAQGDTVRVTHVVKPTSITQAALSKDRANIAKPTTSRVELKLDYWPSVHWDIGDDEDYSVGRSAYGAVARTYGEALGDIVESCLFYELAQAVGGNTTGTTGTTAYSASNTDTILSTRQKLVERDADRGALVTVLTPAACSRLLGNDDFNRADSRGGEGVETGRTAMLGTKFGFRFYESNNIPKQNIAHSGNGALVGAHAVGSTSIAVDGFNAAGVFGGELLTIGGKTYAVRDTDHSGMDFSDIGTGRKIIPASGTLHLDRGLEAAGGDNAVVTRGAAHYNNWAFDPVGLAFAMRPTAPPLSTGAGTDVGSWTDPETGFSLTLERSRVEHGTRFKLSCLFGVRVVWPELIQRVLSDS